MPSVSLPPHLRLDRSAFDTGMRTYPLTRVIRTQLHDAERIPQGPSILVGNHGPLAIDTALLVHALHRDFDRVVRTLGDRMLFAHPIGRLLAKGFGGVEANPDNARQLLAAGECVLVYPGGARETLRDTGHRYQLSWEGRLGFARLALAAQVPIIPVACIGSDDLLMQVVDRETMRASWLGRLTSSLVGDDYIPPLYVPRLRPTQFHYFFGEPILPSAPPEDAADASAVRSHQELARRGLEALVEHGREVRRTRLHAQE
jgi:1-acyl-sn-glycerol-3-phosphate acyltransferase